MIMRLLDHWRAGQHYRFPLCCRIEFIKDQILMEPVQAVLPEALQETAYRLRKALSVRYHLADGLVPCSYHAARWVVTGKPPMDPSERVGGDKCCEFRDLGPEILDLHLVPLVLPEYPDSVVWVLRQGEEEGPKDDMLEADIHVHHCPWCGTSLNDSPTC